MRRASGSRAAREQPPHHGAGQEGGRVGFMSCGCGSKPMGSHFGVGAPPILVYFGGDWDVHWGTLTRGHMVKLYGSL